MAKFTLEITCDNAAFHSEEDFDDDEERRAADLESAARELAWMLREEAKRLDMGIRDRSDSLFDSNGNKVGTATYTPDGGE